MKIYTKKGDGGDTSLRGGTRVSKGDQRMQALGTLDELNAILGLTRCVYDTGELEKAQNLLFDAGAALASLAVDDCSWLDPSWLEDSIDRMERDLDPLTNFILPGGSEAAARLHLARTVCRRAERELVQLKVLISVPDELLVFLNRLSDWLFVAARYANHELGNPDIHWKAHKP